MAPPDREVAITTTERGFRGPKGVLGVLKLGPTPEPKLGTFTTPPCMDTPWVRIAVVGFAPAPPGPGPFEIPPFAFGSAPRPAPSGPDPGPSPRLPLPGPLP